MFVLCCPAFTKLLAKRSFKTLIRPVILRLANDPVPNVRECILRMIVNEPGMSKVVCVIHSQTRT